MAALVGALVVSVVGAIAASALSTRAPETIGTAGASRGFPRVAVDSEGRGFVVWHNYGRGISRNGWIQAVRVGIAGRTDSPRLLSDPSRDAANPELGVDGNGRATIVWQDRSSGRVQWTRLGAGGLQTAVETMPGDGAYPQVAVSEGGAAVVAWTAFEDGLPWSLRAVLIQPDGSMGPVQQLDGSAGSVDGEDFYRVAIDSLGRATVVWEDLNNGKPAVYAAKLDEEGDAGPRRMLSIPGKLSYIGSVAVDQTGVSTVAWSERSGRIKVRRIRSDGTPAAVRRLSRKGFNGLPQVVAHGPGRATVAWAGGGPLRWVRLGPDGAPGRRGSLKGGGLGDMAVARSGRVWFTWSSVKSRNSGPTTASVKVMRLSREGKRGRVETLSRPGEDVYDFQGYAGPEIAAGGNGVARVVWPNLATRNPAIRLAAAR